MFLRSRGLGGAIVHVTCKKLVYTPIKELRAKEEGKDYLRESSCTL